MFGRRAGSSPRNELPAFDGFSYDMSLEWRTFPVSRFPGEDAEGEVTAARAAAIEHMGRELTSSDAAYEVLVTHAGHLCPAMASEPHLLAALWAPVPDTGEVWAGMVLDLLVDRDDSGAGRDEWLAVREKEPIPNLLRRDVERCDVPLGPAVLVVEVARDDAGSLELRVEITVFPDSCRDGLQVTVLSPRLDCEDLLVGEAAFWADHLTLRTAP